MTDLETVRQELLERGDEMVSFRQLVERFEEVEEYFKGIPWNLRQIYNNFNILIGEKPCSDCISREALLKKQYRIDDSATLSTRDVVNVEDIEEASSIQPQQRTGQDVLDKIRAEIDGLTYYWCEVNPRSVIDDVLNIIDKYRKESEE